MRSSFFALALAAATAVPAAAQTAPGSGVAPATVGNSTPRAILFATAAQPGGMLVVPMGNAQLPDLAAAGVGDDVRQPLLRAIRDAKFEGKPKQQLDLRGLGGWRRVVLVGYGPVAGDARDAVGQAAQLLRDEDGPVVVAGDAAAPELLALGYALGQYRFDRYKTVGKSAPPTQPVTIVSPLAERGRAEYAGRWSALAEGVTLARDLSSEPANVVYPESFVTRVQAAFAGVRNVRIEVLDEAAMRRNNMGSLLGVGQGAHRPPRLLLVSYAGGSGAPLAVVGKGITFDSGGISLKPGAGMWQMKADMSGAASAVGTALSLAKSGARTNFVAVAALAENMPGGNAQRPGDVVRTMSGKTIEVLNTDAEGRLVMADATEYVADRHKPAGIVTIATLTGAAAAALDDEFGALFARDEALAARIDAAGKAVGEPVWRLPLHRNYAEDMKSDIADIKNVVEGGRPGAGLAAHFVQYFVPEAVPHAHLDMAGVMWVDRGRGVTPKGSPGWGVMLLDRLARGE